MAHQRLIYGAVILFAANLINRILGFIYQYLIMRYIGSEAYGLFYMVFPVYMTALVFATAGIPLAISKMVSEKISLGRFGDAQGIFRIAFISLFLSGLFVSVILFSQTSLIVARFFSDDRVFRVFQICIPSIFIVSISSAFRGYFQGLQNMIPSAVSQICEQITRVIVGFTLSFKFLDQGVEWAAAGLATGMLSGEIIGLLVIIIQYLKRKKYLLNNPCEQTTRSILSDIFTLSLPISGGRLVSSGLSSLEAFIIPRQLQMAGLTAGSAASLFGQLGGTALTLLSFPSVFTFALATSLVPAISEAMIRKDYKLTRMRCSDSIRFTLILGIPFVLLLNYYAEPLSRLFNSSEVSAVLRILTVGGIFTYLQQTTTGILQGLGKTSLPLIHSIISAMIRLPLIFYLTAIPEFGLEGTAWAIVTGYVLMATLNILAIRRLTGFRFEIKSFILLPLVAGLGMLIIIRLLSDVIPAGTTTGVLLTLIGFSFYFVFLVFTGVINPNEIRKIPLAKKIIPKRFL